MNGENLDDTYDLLSPLRRSYTYSDSFASSHEDSSLRHATSPGPLRSLVNSQKLPSPRFASTSKYPNTNVTVQQKNPAQKRKTVRKVKASHQEKEHDTTKDLMTIPPKDGKVGDLTVWEDWLVKKVLAEREIQEKKHQELMRKREEEEKLKIEKDERKKRAEIKHQQWCEEKVLKIKLQKASERREKLLQEELKSQKAKEIERKAKDAYQKWLIEQERKKEELQEKERLKKEKEEAEKEERKKKSEECYQKWLRRVQKEEATSPRPKSAGPNEYPSPSFTNPRPWVGPMSDKYTRDSVRRQHKQMIAEKHSAIQKSRTRPSSATSRTRKGLVKTGPQKNSKGVLICRPATAAPIFHNIPSKNNSKFMSDTKQSTRGRS